MTLANLLSQSHEGRTPEENIDFTRRSRESWPTNPDLPLGSFASLKLQPGEFVSVLNSTPDSRKALVTGAETTFAQNPLSGAARLANTPSLLRLGSLTFIKGKSILENLSQAFELQGQHCNKAREHALALLRQFRLDGFENHHLTELPAAFQTRAKLARALANRPRLLVLEDCFTPFETRTRHQLLEDFLDSWERERTSVLSFTSLPQDAILLSDRIILLSSDSKEKHREHVPPYPRPRNLSISSESGFLQLLGRINAELTLLNPIASIEYHI
jgi:ABC-type sugar transport system ATPase subunit